MSGKRGYDARCGVLVKGLARRRLALVCEVCGADLLAGRDDRPMVLEHLQAIAGLHYDRAHPERALA